MKSERLYDNEDYDRIAQAIAFMRQHHLSQPDLATVAQHLGLSEYHFQRLFAQWAGISPKRFLQYLTIEYAKSKINQTQSLLDLTFKALTVTYLIPAFAMVWGAVILKEPITSSMVFGCGLILLGTAIANDLFKGLRIGEG